MLSSKEIAQNQLEQITEQQKKTKQAKPVQPNKQAGRSYNASLQKLVKAIKKDINEKITPLIRSLEPQYIGDSSVVMDSWADDIIAIFATLKKRWQSPEFINAAKKVSSDFVKSVNTQHSARFKSTVKSVGVTGLDIFGDSPKLQDILSASVADNTRLITTIPETYLNQVQSIVVSNMRAGLRPSAIEKQLSQQFNVSVRRARVIARDQTTKANGELSKQRQEDTGFQFFKWKTSDDIKVRDDHERIENKDIGFGKGVYKWDNPPKNKDGVQIIPGQEIQCRCVAIPVTTRQVSENKVKG